METEQRKKIKLFSSSIITGIYNCNTDYINCVRACVCVSPVCGEALPEGDASISSVGQHPGVGASLGPGAHTHVRIQTEAKQQAAQQGGMVLTVPLEGTYAHNIRRQGTFLRHWR